eukprot:TRINITY_DN14041_c0_g1_i1.p2 TRINITY_DN14041_c0_g1~~TRINITY_DN14041_c0_g1_i1.p2  ORF type:complete len:217 (+),score=83.26 TRINITY_DN14041_c0_g1_i1:81-731(+)
MSLFGGLFDSQACKPCSTADPTSDTVRIPDAEEIAAREAEAEEHRQAAEAEARRQAEEAARQEAERRRQAEEAVRRAEQERVQQEQRQREEQERLAAEEERRRAAEEQRQQEAARQAAEEAARRALEEANAHAADYCKKNGFAEVNARKKSFMSSMYPLHKAVKDNNAAAVRALLTARADASAQNSSKQTALQLAEKTNYGKNTHEEVVQLLRAAC